MQLRHGMNPHQTPATWAPITPGAAPARLVSGLPSYVNLLDALGSWQLVREAARVLGLPVVMIVRPDKPAGHVVASPEEAVAWLVHEAARSPRGV